MKFLTTGQSLEFQFRHCLNRFSQLRFAVAWATQHFELGSELIRYSTKVKRAVVGTHFFQTDPEFMRSWQRHAGMRFNFRTGGVFHPKVYLFENSPMEWAAFVGSANFTRGGFVKNDEATLYFSSEDSGAADIYRQIHISLDEYWRDAEHELTDEMLNSYIAKRSRRRAAMIELEAGEDPTIQPPRMEFRLSEVMTMPWDRYTEAIRSRDELIFEARCLILKIFRRYFASKEHFVDLEHKQQKRIAGVEFKDSTADWQYFGANNSAGEFTGSLEAIAEGISLALDAIPLRGEVTREQFETYLERFKEAKDRGVARGIKSRFLAMKRPDQFICVNGANEDRLASVLETSVGSIKDIESYWDRVVVPLRRTPWYNEPNPAGGPTSDTWYGRVALLDCICYDRNAVR